MDQSTANDFYNRIVEGTDYAKTIELEHGSGASLEGVKVHPVDKQDLADVIEALPEDLFDAVEDADSPEEAEEMMEDQGMSVGSLGSDAVEEFENVVKQSLSHPELTNTQMSQIVSSLDFAVLFELGGEIIDMSFSEGGAIQDFQEQE